MIEIYWDGLKLVAVVVIAFAVLVPVEAGSWLLYYRSFIKESTNES